MLPYHLRVPVYGKSNEHLKKSAAEEEAIAVRGGPVQGAIEDDILLLQAKYVNEMQKQSQEQDHDDNEGFAFGIFRELFTKSKVAMLHLLLPKISCDKEAYSQLIFAACFQVFRQEFEGKNGEELSLEKTGVALFCLYALYETNPLPRTTKSPFELLSMGLQGDENYRALYRRVFKQNIRIDHEHYALLLRLRQLCLARIDGCGKRLNTLKLQNENNGTFKCNCSIARDTIHVMDKLATKCDYCDYTGPAGLEGLAGHSDYVVTKPSSTSTLSSDPIETTIASAEFPLSTDLKESLQAYQNAVKEIRVPVGKTHTATKVRKCLEDFFTKTRKDPMSQVEARLFGTTSSGLPETQEVSGDGEQALQDKMGDTNETNSRVVVGREKETATGNNADASLPSFKSIVPPGLQNDTKKYIHQALGSLFERQLPLLQTAAVVGGEQADDVSSVGFGGISVATGGGRNALQTLLSKANASKGVPSRVGAANTRSKRQVDNVLMQFLTAENTLDQADSDDEGSDVSNISISDYDDDDDDDNKLDDASIATSAAGKQALSSLLHRVKKNQSQVQKSNSSKKRTPVARKKTKQSVAKLKSRAKTPTKVDGSGDAASTGTSVGGGQNALAALLGEAQRTKSGNGAKKRRHTGGEKKNENRHQAKQSKRSRVSKKTTKELDNLSMASSIGNGQNALGNLLAQAKSTKGGINANSDAMSLASSVGHGEGALVNLLSRAGGETKLSREDRSELASVATSVGQGQGALNVLLAQSESREEHDGDFESMATSTAPGKGALDAFAEGSGTMI